MEALGKEQKKVKFPPQTEGGDAILLSADNPIVIVGPNGCGKSRLSLWLKDNITDVRSYRIAANRNLTMPDDINMVSRDAAMQELVPVNQKKKYNHKPAGVIQSDFSALLNLVLADHIKCATMFLAQKDPSNSSKPETLFNRVLSKPYLSNS